MASKVVVIIPARWGSTRFPGKALHPIAGKPLVQHVWERCVRARGIDEVIIATDEMRIAEAAFEFGAEVALTSPKHQSGTDRIAEVAKRLRGVSHVINVQGDEPVIEPTLISRLARTMVEDPKLQMITAANKFAADEDVNNPNAVKVVLDRTGNGLYFSRSAIPYVRGDGERPTFYRHQGIYGYTLPFLLQFVRWKAGALEKAEQLEQLRALENGAKIRVVITAKPSVGVDSPDDVAAAELLLAGASARKNRRS
ncbi:MAG TPA: 3-deoxy-manno-octulosonate cytidylyltransferase [Chthoniobacteraceae bacterium]|jgi:3-deoxy-manno-octulosonate cytidylyltransferase (CMP-KDO synthetase)